MDTTGGEQGQNKNNGVSRSDFLKWGSTIAGSAVLVAATSGCNNNVDIKPEESSPVLPNTPEVTISPMEQEFKNNGLIMVKEPEIFPTKGFQLGVDQFPYAIQEGSPFIGPYRLTYSAQKGVFETVTWLQHREEGETLAASQLLPILYPLPKEVTGLSVSAFAIPIPNSPEKSIALDPMKKYYLVPIVTAGNSDGIVPIKDANGRIVSGGTYDPFPIEEINQSNRGYLSWALLSFDQEDITMVGVVKGSNMKINPEEVPDIVKKVLEKK